MNRDSTTLSTLIITSRASNIIRMYTTIPYTHRLKGVTSQESTVIAP